MTCNTYQKISVGSSSPFLNERTNNLLMSQNFASIKQSKLLSLGFAIISETAHLNPGFIFSKNLMLSL